MRDLIITLMIFATVPYIFMRPHIGAYAWAWISYMNPHRLTWGFAYTFPFNQVIAGAALISLFFSKEPKKFPWCGATVIWLAFVAWECVTTVFAIDPAHSAVEWERAMKIHLMILFTLLTINTRERLNGLVWVIALSIGFYGFKGGLFTIAKGGKFLVWGPDYSFIAGNNEIAFALVCILPLIYYLTTLVNRKIFKWGLLFGIAMCIASILGTYSRGAFLAMGAIGFVLFLKSDRKFPIFFAMIFVAIAVFAAMPKEYMERMNTIKTYEQDGSALGRINAWYYAVNLANDYPITGGGFTTFLPELFLKYAPEPLNFHDAHSIYFEVLAEQGYVGLVLFLLMGILSLLNCNWILRHSKGIEELKWANTLAAMLQVSFVGYAVGGAFLGLAYWDLPYHLMAMTVILRNIVAADLADLEKQGKLPVKQTPFGNRFNTKVAAARTPYS